MHTLKVNFSTEYKQDLAKQKRVWNFVKSDLNKIFSSTDVDSKVSVSPLEGGAFLIEYKTDNEAYEIRIDSSLSFIHSLDLKSNDTVFLGLMLSVIFRLQRTYKNTFSVKCDYYLIVAKAVQLLQSSLDIKVDHNWLCTFVKYPVPGRKPEFGKALNSAQIVKRSEDKKRQMGKVRLSSWLSESIRIELAEFCRIKGYTLEEALSEIIPLGLNISTYLNTKNKEDENKAI